MTMPIRTHRLAALAAAVLLAGCGMLDTQQPNVIDPNSLNTPQGAEAAWQAGDCYRALGELTRARQSLEALLEVAEYRSRAEAALQELNAREEQVAAARKAKAAAPTGAAPASPPAAASPPPAKAAPKVDASQ